MTGAANAAHMAMLSQNESPSTVDSTLLYCETVAKIHIATTAITIPAKKLTPANGHTRRSFIASSAQVGLPSYNTRPPPTSHISGTTTANHAQCSTSPAPPLFAIPFIVWAGLIVIEEQIDFPFLIFQFGKASGGKLAAYLFLGISEANFILLILPPIRHPTLLNW